MFLKYLLMMHSLICLLAFIFVLNVHSCLFLEFACSYNSLMIVLNIH